MCGLFDRTESTPCSFSSLRDRTPPDSNNELDNSEDPDEDNDACNGETDERCAWAVVLSPRVVWREAFSSTHHSCCKLFTFVVAADDGDE